MCKNTDLEERRPLSAAAPAQTAAEIPPSPASVAVRLRPSRFHADADGPLEGLPVVSSEASGGKKSDEIEVGWPFVCKVLGMLGLLFFVGLQLGTHAPSWIEKPGNSEFVEEAGERSDETDHNKDYLVEFLSTPSPGRDRIIDLIVDEYTDPHSIDKSTGSRLDDALSMLDKLGSDGEPVQVEGRPYLFVGSVGASLNGDSLRSHNITHIINWSPTAKCDMIDGMEYLCFNDIDTKEQMMKHVEHLHEGVEFIDAARQAGGAALSHCWYGRNRSVSLLVAYLMKDEGMTISEATKLIKKTRPQADPYTNVLREYARRYLGDE